MQRAYRNSTRILGVLMMLLGAAMVATAFAGGGGPASFGVILGIMFAALGAARFHLAGHQREDR